MPENKASNIENENVREITNFIWNVIANKLLWNKIKKGKFCDVIFPFTVLRRLDCIIEPKQEEVLATYNKYKDLKDKTGVLTKVTGVAFYNTSKYTFKKLLNDSPNIKANFISYLNGYSENIQEIIKKFKFINVVEDLSEKEILYSMVKEFSSPKVDLSPESISNHQMGYIFEELIREYNESTNENPGEHFTPREIIKLMVSLIIAKDEEKIKRRGAIVTVLDPCCGSGGMLTVAKDEIAKVNDKASVELFGQESVDETYAACKADMLIKGEDPDKIKPNSSFSDDGHKSRHFDYILMNPPYGYKWSTDKDFIDREALTGGAGRFEAGTPSIDEGSLLFLQHAISKMYKDKHQSRIAIVYNGSPLFNGDAQSGESEIRRWVFENDWLEAIIGLPNQLFYNTGIHTYIWMLTNKKDDIDKGKVKMIDARELYEKMGKSLGGKTNYMTEQHISTIVDMYISESKSENVKIFKTTEFAYRKVQIERPLRLNFQASAERIAKLDDVTAFRNLAISRKKKKEEKDEEEMEGRNAQEKIKSVLGSMPQNLFKSAKDFEAIIVKHFSREKFSIKAPIKKAILAALSEKDETADIVKDKVGNPLPDTDLRDHEYIPYEDNIEKYFEREVKPHVTDAWIDENYTDLKDGKTGRVGYEINFNRYFYKYSPPRLLEKIDRDIEKINNQITDMLKTITTR